jgi:tetratricopeptide (TPR) repeat protein
VLLDVLADAQGDPLVAMPVGFALAQAELWPYAELAFQHATNVNPDYAEAQAYVGLARDRQGKDGDAWVARALTLDQQSDTVRFIQGLHLRQKQDFAGSLEAFVLAVALNPQNPAYYAELGTAYRLADDMDNAERWLQVAVDVSNRDPRFQQLLALFYADEEYQLNDGGLALLESLTQAMPDDLDVQAGFGWALYQAGDPQGALAQLDGILERVPDHARSLYYKATIWLETDHLDRAIPLFEQVATQPSPFQEEARRIIEGLRG